MRDKYPVGGKYCNMDVSPKFEEVVNKHNTYVDSYKNGIYIDINKFSVHYGDDLDRLIATLRRAKSAWLKAYRKEQRIVAKRKGR